MVIASPAGAYFAKGLKPVSIWLSEDYTRAGRGGMGAAKTGGNYASSLVAQQEAIEQGCDQVVFLDAAEGKYVEELGGMNLYFVHDDGTIVTPELSGTILEGITRSSIMELGGKLGHQVEERRFTIDEWRDGVASGRITEVFACGTAAVVTPVGTAQVARRRRSARATTPARSPSRSAPRSSTSSTAAPRTRSAGCTASSDPAAAAAGTRGRVAHRLVRGAPHRAAPSGRAGDYRLLDQDRRGRHGRGAPGAGPGRPPGRAQGAAPARHRRRRGPRTAGPRGRLAATGHQPRIAEVIDADPWGETPYVATRYVPGLSLHEHVGQEGPITGPDLAHFARGLAEAVIAVHQVGVLHRDIKPSNVLIEGRAPVLIDFGLARLAEDPRLTHTGWLLGTPGYLAPEILYGDDATTASDVHSWAATLVFASTGQPPFGTGPAMAVMDRVRRGEHDLSAVPRAVLPLLEACLAPDPEDRHHRDPALRAAAVRPATRGPRRRRCPRPPDPAVRAGHARGSRRRRRHRRVRHRPPDGRLHPRRSGHRSGHHAGDRTPARAAGGPGAVHAAPGAAAAHARRPTRRRPRARGAAAGAAVPDAAHPAAHRSLRRGGARLRAGAVPRLAAVGALTLAVRTVSWTTDSARRRQQVRGGPRWYDAPLAVPSSPWYLVVATAGTLVLLVWAALVGFVAGFAYLLFRAPLVPGLLLMGAVVALAVWWGPGSRRVRGADPRAGPRRYRERVGRLAGGRNRGGRRGAARSRAAHRRGAVEPRRRVAAGGRARCSVTCCAGSDRSPAAGRRPLGWAGLCVCASSGSSRC